LAWKVGAEVVVAAAAAVGVPALLPAGVLEMEEDGALAVTPKPVVLPGAVVGILIDEDELVDLAEDWATETLVDPDVLNAPILKSPVVE